MLNHVPPHTFIILAVLILNIVAEISSVFMEEVASLPLDVRIDDGDQLAPLGCQVRDHVSWVGEL